MSAYRNSPSANSDSRFASTPIDSYRSLGYEIYKALEYAGDAFRVQQDLLNNGNPVIFDVGAHRGQTALTYRRLFQSAHIVCFEPYDSSFAVLVDAVATDASN